ERAKRMMPSGGRKPWGRVYDRKTGQWKVDEAKQQQLLEIAQRYLAGERMSTLAKIYGWHQGNLYETLREHSGPLWTLRFKSPALNIDETIPIAVPELLNAKTREKIRERLVERRTRRNGSKSDKHKYLLSGFIYCGACGKALVGQPFNRPGRTYLYYRH